MTQLGLTCRGTDSGVMLAVRVLPRGSCDELVGVREGRLCIRTTAPPVEGAANSRVVEYLAKVLGCRKSRITIVSGEKSRDKTLAIRGVCPEEIITAIQATLDG